ncbi:biotin/lipoyl-binding protein [Acidimicrobiaceae bacterium]|jgi:acetyl-CoA/propionyl-CoA carboxylase biotin carboxyl carrier protein|nr:biotin/lipoyl-binding protein [Acidimicrobiaceae bacterium]MDA9732763.1 biotin/lipoyl-binding protein [Acidimicrobiaceae bacterium]MDC2977468.1 biotin/lipoyl-binding protein [Acidimicrobiaceae bacterium]|tara:strand:- start:1277 stop:2965 length:1689 start_codon:yes stop_codon:yes gene_type:complete
MTKKRVLIANRGEIALRIIRSVKEMDMHAIAVYSDVDADSLHVKRADESFYLGGSLPADSYRNLKNLMKAVIETKADMVHPGYGFLAENADFAKAVQKKDVIWIGPNPETIKSMGDKIESRKLISKAGLMPVPGQLKPSRTKREAMKDANNFGYPVALKAAHGGGGKGLRIVNNEEELDQNYEIVKRESEAYFGSDQIYVEKFIKPARHVETQILSDKYGNHVYLGERDCSLQRRNQKLIEESPPVWLSEFGKEELKKATLMIAKSSNYVNAGTVEFLADNDENFYFLEMNTRLQVEHTVTEMRYGIDLVKEQIKIALGNSLEDFETEARGHSIEFRINAEDPANNFLPTPGTITEYREPMGNGVRVDGWVKTGTSISHFYDNLISKLVVWGVSREEAISKGKRCLDEYIIGGIPTTISLLSQVISTKEFKESQIHVKFLEENFKIKDISEEETISDRPSKVNISLDDNESQSLAPQRPKKIGMDLTGNIRNPGIIKADMQGTIMDTMTKKGKKVKKGDSLFVLEAMKMENVVTAPIGGVIKEFNIKKGQPVNKGDILVEIG